MNRFQLRKALLFANCLGLNEVNLEYCEKELGEVLDKYFSKTKKVKKK